MGIKSVVDLDNLIGRERPDSVSRQHPPNPRGRYGQRVPRVGESDLFETRYRAELERRLTPYGILIEYSADRAALDGGLHLYKKGGDGRGAEVGDVRVWFQCKGIQESTLSVEELTSRDTVAVAGVSIDHVRFWYSAPEPVYLVVYLEALDDFVAADVRDLVDRLGGGAFLQQLRAKGQATLTLQIPRDESLERALRAMPAHRSLRIDGPAFRGRPLGHRYDPLRSELAKMPPPLFEELVGRLLDAHDFRTQHDVDLAPLVGRDVGRVSATLGTLYLTFEWTFPGATEYGFDEGSDFRLEARPESAHGDVLVVCDSRVDAMPRRNAATEQLVAEMQASGIEHALVFFNESEMTMPALFGSWRVALEPLVHTPQGLGSLAFNVLTTTLVYLDLVDRLSWRYLNYL